MTNARADMMATWFFDRLDQFGPRTAIIWHGQELAYGELVARLNEWRERFAAAGVGPGTVCGILGDHTIEACLALLASWREGLIAAPICSLPEPLHATCLATAGAEVAISFAGDGKARFKRLTPTAQPSLLAELQHTGEPGVVLFSSGSTGNPKAVLWDANRLMERHRAATDAPRTLAFLRLDHIGGLNTLLYTLCGGGTLIVPADRDPTTVCRTIAKHRVELLPTTPTFLRMLLVSGAWQEFDLSSLERITYGAEPMPESVLHALAEALPRMDLKQTYGLSELGILPTQSRSRDSLWLRLGGAETRVVDGQLWLRTPAAMLGYLNHISPLDADGWFNTQDAVEVDGPYLRILGRTSDTINVGGEKVHSVEIENVLLTADNVREAVVRGRRSPVTGQIVAAAVVLQGHEDGADAERRLIAHCRQRLAPHQVPMLIEIVEGPLHNERGKAVRRCAGATS